MQYEVISRKLSTFHIIRRILQLSYYKIDVILKVMLIFNIDFLFQIYCIIGEISGFEIGSLIRLSTGLMVTLNDPLFLRVTVKTKKIWRRIPISLEFKFIKLCFPQFTDLLFPFIYLHVFTCVFSVYWCKHI